MLYLVIMLVMVSREMMTGAGIFVTFPVDTVENGRLVTVTGEVFRIDRTYRSDIFLHMSKEIIPLHLAIR